MDDRNTLSEQEWERLLPLLRSHPRVHVGNPMRCRRFVDEVFRILRSGAQWRQLRHSQTNWNSVFKRFSAWAKHGVWQTVLDTLAQGADLQNICIDSTVNRAHACAAGAVASTAEAEALGRSRGGFTTKVHMAVDALGLPVRFLLTGGQRADVSQAQALVMGIPAGMVIADKGYDSDQFVSWLQEQGVQAVIPPKSNRKEPRACDFVTYKERHVVECTFGKLKHYRRMAFRFEKKASHYMEMLAFAAVLLWLR